MNRSVLKIFRQAKLILTRAKPGQSIVWASVQKATKNEWGP